MRKPTPLATVFDAESDAVHAMQSAPSYRDWVLFLQLMQTTRVQRQPPQLAAACNEMQNLVEALARDEAFTDTEGSLDADEDRIIMGRCTRMRG